MGSNLASLAAHYADGYGDEIDYRESLRALHDGYVRERETGILDAVSTTAALDALVFSDQVDTSAITPQLREAFELAFPNRSIDDLDRLSPESARGWLHAWKGKLFEVEVKDRLNDGRGVGDLQLGPGQHAVLADSPTQPGWDLRIVSQDGSEPSLFQLKATERLSLIKQAQERYPDIEVLATDEAATKMADTVVNSGMSDAGLEAQVAAPMEDMLDTPVEEFAETALPGLPFVLITTTEGAKVLMGRHTLQEAANRIAGRGLTTGAAMGLGYTLATLTGAGIISLPATFATRLGISRFQILRGLSRRLKSDIESIRTLQEGMP